MSFFLIAKYAKIFYVFVRRLLITVGLGMEKIMPIENMPTSGNNCDESIREMREKYNNKKEKNQIKSGKL